MEKSLSTVYSWFADEEDVSEITVIDINSLSNLCDNDE